MISFIDDHRGAHGVEPICKVLPIAPSTYHAHVAKRRDPAKLSARARQDAALKIEVRRVFEENFSVYGVRKELTSLLDQYGITEEQIRAKAIERCGSSIQMFKRMEDNNDKCIRRTLKEHERRAARQTEESADPSEEARS